MHLLPTITAPWENIEGFSSLHSTTTRLADGLGEAHAHMVRIEAGGIIDRHEAGFGQLWIVVEGKGWVAGGDDRRVEVSSGDVAFVERGESHAKGSDHGMAAVMIQIYDLQPMLGMDTD